MRSVKWQLKTSTFLQMQGAELRKLKPFSRREQKEYLLASFALKEMDKDVLAFCCERADGGPLILRSIVQTLLDARLCFIDNSRILQLDSTKVPDPAQLETLKTSDTVRDLMQARLSKIHPSALSILFSASTIGRHFSYRHLRRVRGENSGTALRRHLKSLCESGLLLQKGSSLQFASSTTQQVCYEMQSLETREKNHYRIASMLIERLDELENADLDDSGYSDGFRGLDATHSFKRRKNRVRSNMSSRLFTASSGSGIYTTTVPRAASSIREKSRRASSIPDVKASPSRASRSHSRSLAGVATVASEYLPKIAAHLLAARKRIQAL